MKATRVLTFLFLIVIFIFHLISSTLNIESATFTSELLFEGTSQITVILFISVSVLISIFLMASKNKKLFSILTLVPVLCLFLTMVISIFNIENDPYSIYILLNPDYAFEKGMNYFLALGSVLLTTAVLLLSLISIIFVFKKQSGLIHKSTSNSTSNSQNTMDLVNRFNQNNDEENQQPNFNFTSTPTEAPSAQDKINELRESLANDNLENAQFDETEYEQTVINHQEESTNEIQSQIEQVEAEIELLKNQQSNLESQNNIDTQPILNKPQEVNRVEQKVSTAVKNYESSPKDPYLQTIVPRRAVQKAADFSKPIGNKRLSESNNFRERNAKVDQSYQNKVFLGDSDRIWEAIKNNDRKLVNNNENNTKDVIQEVREIKKQHFSDPLAPKNDDRNDKNPTIDWGE